MAKKARKKKGTPPRTSTGRFKKAARKKAAPKKAAGTQVGMFGRTIKRKRKVAVKRTKRGRAADRKRTALPAGTRVSRTGRKYTERRANRAD